MQVFLKYGNGNVKVQLPRERLLEMLKPRPLLVHGQDVQDALAAPVGTDRLDRLVSREDRVAIVVSDITRPCPTRTILPHVVRLLKKGGVPRDHLRILIATGTHRAHTPAERRNLLGSSAGAIPEIIDHTMEPVQYIGTTKRGTKVAVDPALLDSDFALAIGNVDVHYFAGYTGGYKAVIPGVAGRETIERNHSLMTLPNAEPCLLDSNPVREDMEEAAQMTGLHYIVNVVLNEANRIVAAFAGDPVAAHRPAAKVVDEFVKTPIRERADIVLASAGGYPRDINLYQAHKAIENASHAVKDGGTVVLLAECREGWGNANFQTWSTGASSLDELRDRLSSKFVLGGHKAFALSKIARRAEIIVVSDKFEAHNLILRTFRKPQNAVDHAWRSQGRDASILLMPYSMNTLPAVSS